MFSTKLGVISSSGSVNFAFKLKKLGGLKRLARTPYMRNLWNVMKTFHVLPTNPDFRNLSDEQLDLILFSMEEDYREAELARKGLRVDSEYMDTSFDEEVWNRDVGDWEVLKDGHDPDDIARQVNELTREEDKENLMSKFDSLDDYNKYLEEGGKTVRETEVEEYMNRQIEAAMEKAKMMAANKNKNKGFVDDRDLPEVQESNKQNLGELDKATMDKAIALFNDENKDDDDDDFTIL